MQVKDFIAVAACAAAIPTMACSAVATAFQGIAGAMDDAKAASIGGHRRGSEG